MAALESGTDGMKMYNPGEFYKKSLEAFGYNKIWNCYFGYVKPSKYKTGIDFIDKLYFLD